MSSPRPFARDEHGLIPATYATPSHMQQFGYVLEPKIVEAAS